MHSHLDKFPDNCGDYSDEQGGTVPSRYQNDGKAISREMGSSHDG